MFAAVVENGRISLGNDLNRERVRLWCAKNEGARVEITPILPESGKLRRFFEGAIVPLVTFYQEGRSYRIPGGAETYIDYLVEVGLLKH